MDYDDLADALKQRGCLPRDGADGYSSRLLLCGRGTHALAAVAAGGKLPTLRLHQFAQKPAVLQR